MSGESSPSGPSSSGLFRVLVVLVVLGLICWVLVHFVPMPWPFDNLVIAVAVIGGLLFAVREMRLF